jgi:hypothetical protein
MLDPPALIGPGTVSIPVLIGPLLRPLVMASSDWLEEVVLTVTWLKVLHHLPHERSSHLAALVPTHVEF